MKEAVNKTCLIGPTIVREQFIPHHLFYFLIKGEMGGFYGGKNYALKPGEYGVARKNRLGRHHPAKVNNRAEKIIFVLDEPFLREFQQKHKTVAVRFKSEESFFKLPENEMIPNFIQSLMPYYNTRGQMDKAFFDVKREELLLIVLHLQPELSGVFFDYGIPQKIELEEFMNRNYKFNVSIERFAYLTGRSLSAFKRDFQSIFNETPSRWLIKKRLEDAYFLIDKKNKKPTEIYLELGFEALSHFSFAFKKLFGQTPTELSARKADINLHL